ncbi:unnamed protein product [Cylindrotheca closterium]|uniref:Sodium/hydrogen exchanger n=1 Tax=Cylindrotheca closterium TaxID=2856 RepID=A0AAD2FLN7_9STRA|nr:unnamed protein product [Cylindrotheca closterium]
MADEISVAPSATPTVYVNYTDGFVQAELAEEAHEFDAISALVLNITIIICLLLAYFVKRYQIYYLPESAGALLIGIIIGGIATLSTEKLTLFKFDPELFFFFLLPPIIFEAGYSLDRQGFFENIGAITLYAMFGTMISTFVVGIMCFYAAKLGMIQSIDKENPMEALLFGALISAVDPVATLSIMGNDDLNVDPLLYSLVFGESVLNDAIAISLFRTFAKYYKPDGPDWSESEIPGALLSFLVVTTLSIVVGVGLGLVASWIYKHTDLNFFPKLETSLLFCFCYLCYATAEAVELSGIMALFFQGVTLSHYNSYNLSETAHVASEEIFSTFATITETVVFIYMGMGVFTGRFSNWDVGFSVLSLIACLIGRFLNIVPLSFVANFWRKGRNRITGQMQVVLWFAGLRGAIAFALAENMPGNHKEVYSTATLSICIFTIVVCGGFTERMLTMFGMKEDQTPSLGMSPSSGDRVLTRITYEPHTPSRRESLVDRHRRRLHHGIKGIWQRVDENFLMVHFGGDADRPRSSPEPEYEMGSIQNDSSEDSSENGEESSFLR